VDHEPLPQKRSATSELIEAGPEQGSGTSPVLYRPEPKFRSPLVKSRHVEAPRRNPDSEVPTLALPSARALLRPTAWAALVAAPLLLLIGWQIALVFGVLAAATRELDARFRRANISFAEGFLPFRDRSAWPQGVQEEDGVHWHWSPRARNGQTSRS